MEYYDISEYVKKNESLPEEHRTWNRDVWGMKDKKGFCVAHLAACKGLLPEDFVYWDIRDSLGFSVAHEQVYNYYPLPSDFSQWDMVDRYGKTVAVVAAERSLLPLNFPYWDWKDSDGETIFEKFCISSVAASSCVTNQIRQAYETGSGFDYWDMVLNAEGETCRDVYESFIEK